MTIITALTGEHIPPRPHRHLPESCFYCSADVASGDVHVPGATAELWLHHRCAEELGLGLVRATNWRRRSNGRGLVAIA
jgi:hypothetical protein